MGLSMFDLKLARRSDGVNIATAGGMALVIANGTTTKVPLYTATGGAQANPVALTNGRLLFYAADTVETVDLYIMSPTGHFHVQRGVKRSGPNEIWINETDPNQRLVLPFIATDYTIAAEQDSGFDLPTGAMVDASLGVGVEVTAIDATETLDVGILSSEASGDADGFMALLPLGVLGSISAIHTITTSWPSSTTLGALLRDFTAGSATDDRGSLLYKPHAVLSTSRSVSLTFTTGTDTAAGYIFLPYRLPPSLIG